MTGPVVATIELLRTPATRIPQWSEVPAMSSATFDPIGPAGGAFEPRPAVPMTDAQAEVSTARLADEIYLRWCVAVGEDRQGESAWLVEVSRSLQRAARSFGGRDVIG